MNDEYFSHLIPSSVDGNDIPLGMGEVFAHNLSALMAFASLSNAEQTALIKRAHEVRSPEEMEMLVNGISQSGAIG